VLGTASIVTSRSLDEIRRRNEVRGGAEICGFNEVRGGAEICGFNEVRGGAEIRGFNEIRGGAEIRGLIEIRRVAGGPDRWGCRRTVGFRGPNGGDCPIGGPAAGVRRGSVTRPLPGTD
jgi:hypothetical protein